LRASRRELLEGLLLCASGVLVSGCHKIRALPTESPGPAASAPLLTNYNDSGEPAIVEGRTLLVSLTYPHATERPGGSLPVQIEPESAGGEPLTEPQPLFFFKGQGGRIWRTIISAPLDVVEGDWSLQLSPRDQSNNGLLRSFPYSFRHGRYRSTTLTLDKDFSSPTAEIREQQTRDFEEMREILKQRSERQWSEPFMLPVNKGDSDNFGVRRTVNGTKRYRHRGLDLRAEMGTPVRAVNDGTAVLVREQWTAGLSVCLDHGGGLFSKYAHLSEFKVRTGDPVRRGQVIALSGNSGGQKSPPHLHLDIIINGTHVDPQSFIRTAQQLLEVEAEERSRD
jgi:murein DD-endopeptidase MepM/ murein hydrolase activator NlpD